MKKNIILIGASYSGKTEFSKILSEFFGYKKFSLGEYCRQHNYPINTCLDKQQIFDIIEPILKSNEFIIFDNLFKTSESVSILEKFNIFETSIIEIIDKRTNIDYTSRKRIDDMMIKVKQDIWFNNRIDIINKIKQFGYNINIVYSVDNGFKLDLIKNIS
jgi:adenylate kinase family enzyme